MKSQLEEARTIAKSITEQRQLERERAKPNLNQKMAEDAKDFVDSYDFWCELCEEDFSAPAYKTVIRYFGDTIAIYRSVHEQCGTESIRHITHRDDDPYYNLSEKIHRQRQEYADDVLHPAQYGFRTKWGEAFGEYHKKLQKREEEIIKKEKDRGFNAGLSRKTHEQIQRLYADTN